MNKLQELIIGKLKEHYGDSLYVPEFKSEEEARKFIQENSSDVLYGGDDYISGLFIDYKTLILSEDDELFDEEQLSIEFDWMCGLIDILAFDVSYIKYCKLNNIEVPEDILEKERTAAEEYNKQLEEEEKMYMETIDEYEDLYNEYNRYDPGDDFETDWIRSLE